MLKIVNKDTNNDRRKRVYAEDVAVIKKSRVLYPKATLYSLISRVKC